ncbi:MAG: type-F conjugative transfer system pilin assembly protein TrbC [Pseudomonadota bacterium]
MSSNLAAIGLLTTSLLVQPEPDQEIDRQAIEEAIQAAEEEARLFAITVAGKAEAYAEEAQALTDDVLSREVPGLETGTGPIDLDAMVAGMDGIVRERTRTGEEGGVYVLASLGMPEPSLKRLIEDAHRAEVPVVLRGFVGGSLAETARRIRAVIGVEAEGVLGGVVIDPRVFRVFGAHEVPVFVATASPLPECDGLDCSAPPPPHDRIAGNVSLEAALTALVEEGDEGSAEAGKALARLGREL